MKALTYTVVAGSKACPNDCGICISKMTPSFGIGYDEPVIDWDVFDKATNIAVNRDARYFLITSKGEASLFPSQVSKYLHRVESKPFDRRELQTEGSVIATGGKMYDEFLKVWKDLGLDLVAVSIYHYDNFKNHDVFRSKKKNFYDLEKLIDKFNSHDIKVRLSCVMLKDYVDSIDEVSNLINYSKKNGVFQLTLRTADAPSNPFNGDVANFVNSHKVDGSFNSELVNFFDSHGSLCDVLPHGALIYEVNNQNVALTTGLSTKFKNVALNANDYSVNNDVRQLIFIPPNLLTTSWENIYGGRIL